MAARPSARVVNKLARNVQSRHLAMTGPTTFPSAILTGDKTSDGTTMKRPQAIANANANATSSDAPVREFNTSRVHKARQDTSTIDFAFLPDIARHGGGASAERPQSVPILLGTMYSGIAARAMHEDESEETLRPLINLVSASGTHISTPSAMSEVHDNNTVDFEGIPAGASFTKPVEETVSDVKQFFNDVLDDILGPRKHS